MSLVCVCVRVCVFVCVCVCFFVQANSRSFSLNNKDSPLRFHSPAVLLACLPLACLSAFLTVFLPACLLPACLASCKLVNIRLCSREELQVMQGVFEVQKKQLFLIKVQCRLVKIEHRRVLCEVSE